MKLPVFPVIEGEVRDSDRYFVVATVLKTLENLQKTLPKDDKGRVAFEEATVEELRKAFGVGTGLEFRLYQFSKVDENFRELYPKNRESAAIFYPVLLEWDGFHRDVVKAYMGRIYEGWGDGD